MMVRPRWLFAADSPFKPQGRQVALRVWLRSGNGPQVDTIGPPFSLVRGGELVSCGASNGRHC